MARRARRFPRERSWPLAVLLASSAVAALVIGLLPGTPYGSTSLAMGHGICGTCAAAGVITEAEFRAARGEFPILAAILVTGGLLGAAGALVGPPARRRGDPEPDLPGVESLVLVAGVLIACAGAAALNATAPDARLAAFLPDPPRWPDLEPPDPFRWVPDFLRTTALLAVVAGGAWLGWRRGRRVSPLVERLRARAAAR